MISGAFYIRSKEEGDETVGTTIPAFGEE